MSDKDDVKKAALDALSRPTAKKTSIGGKKAKSASASNPKKEAKSPPPKAENSSKKTPKSSLPEKGSAEAAVHNMAAKAAAGGGSDGDAKDDKQGKDSGSGFLFLVLLLPLAIVGGLYAYATWIQKDGDKTTQTANAKTGEQKSSGKIANPLMTGKSGKEQKTAPVAGKTAPVGAASQETKTAPETTKPAPAATAAPAPAPASKTAKAGAKKVHWNYKSVNWASLDPSFKTCGDGTSQSPIDIRAGSGQTGPGFQFNYFPSSGKVVNNGHAVQVDLAKNATGGSNQLLVNGKAYDLKQFHFHTPSENRINGQSFPMEVHLVHKNAQGQLAVVDVMITVGSPNQLVDRMPIPANKGDYSTSGGPNINPALLLPNDRRSFTFTGSLTTPPCTQGVGWIVLKSPLTVSPATLAKFQKVMGKNARPVQPGNGRMIFSSN